MHTWAYHLHGMHGMLVQCASSTFVQDAVQALQLSSSNKRLHRRLGEYIKGRLPSQATKVAQPWRGASDMTGRHVAVAGSVAGATGPRGLPQPQPPALLQTRVSHFHCTLPLAGHHDTSQLKLQESATLHYR